MNSSSSSSSTTTTTTTTTYTTTTTTTATTTTTTMNSPPPTPCSPLSPSSPYALTHPLSIRGPSLPFPLSPTIWGHDKFPLSLKVGLDGVVAGSKMTAETEAALVIVCTRVQRQGTSNTSKILVLLFVIVLVVLVVPVVRGCHRKTWHYYN